MELPDRLAAKLSSDLQKRLRSARGDERLRVIARLEASLAPAAKTDSPEATPSPKEFSSRADYRRALIDHRRRSLADSSGSLVTQLRDLGLEVHGGDLTQTVVLEGGLSQILAALSSPAIQTADLDRALKL